MAYFDRSDIEEYTGFASTDFKNAGVTMNATQWATFCDHIVDWVTHTVNHYCGVPSFDPHVVTEYHDGKGACGDDDTYLDEDLRFYLIEPCISVGTVSEDLNYKTSTILWATRWERSAATAGDYWVGTRGGLTWVMFHDNCPVEGMNNVKIEYTGGYATTSDDYHELRWLSIRIAKNLMLDVKKTQETQTLRNTGIRDYSEMFRPPGANPDILTSDIITDLRRHKRIRMGGPAWD